MRRLLLISAIVLAAGCKVAPPPEAKIETDEQKALYSLGYLVAGNVKPFELTEAELALVNKGFADGAQQKKGVVDDPQTFIPKLQELQTTRAAAAATREKAAGAAFMEKAAAEAGATKLPSGIVITTIKEGTGPMPAATDTVKVHYHGTLTDGKVFDSSVERKEPATFPLNNVIPCWTEGVQKIKVGGKAKLVCPSELAYGDRGSPPTIGPGATLIFEVELLEIVKK
jgi:FKBP-type peptidyl-prolyl cis-trans isomerase FkpA/FKBP-type peptidyl-prolyl cis-trans isomerase FklB